MQQEHLQPEASSKKQRRLGLIITLIINLIVVGYIAVTEFHTNDAAMERVSVADIRLFYLVFGVACFVVAAFMDYSKYRRMLMVAEGTDDRRGALEVALLGKYYDNVTPFGAGGQPFQMHYLKKRGYNAGTSGAAPVAGFLTQQIAFVIIGLVVFIFNQSILDQIILLRVTALIGLFMYALLPMAILLFVAVPKPFKAFIGWAVRLLGKIRIGKWRLLKDPSKTQSTVLTALDQYNHCIRMFRRRPGFFAKLIGLSLLYQLAILSIPFFMLRSFGGSGSWWDTFSLVVYIYAAITIVPTPGNAGAAEASFYAVFSSLEGGMLFWAMIVWRLLVYYSWLICGLVILTRSAVNRPKSRLRTPPKVGPIRVALCNDLFFPTVDDDVVRTVDAYARHLHEAGHSVCVICPESRSGEFDDESLGYEVFRMPAFRFTRYAFDAAFGTKTRALRKSFAQRPPDVIHAHSPYLMGGLALRLGRRFHVPVVATFHSKYREDALNLTHSKLLANIMVNYIVDFYAKADYVWACSERAAETLRGYGYNGVIHVMENGAEPDEAARLHKARRLAVETFDLPEDRHVLLFVGHLLWRRNLRLVLDTVHRLAQEDERYLLLVVGGSGNAEIESYAGSLGIDEHVRFLGKISDRQLLFGLYAYANLLFFPSTYDNAPLVLREAALTALPTLLAEGSNAAEIVEDGVNGFTAPATVEAMSDKIRQIFSDGSLKTVGEAAQKSIPIPWANIVSRAVTAYRTDSEQGLGKRYDIPTVE